MCTCFRLGLPGILTYHGYDPCGCRDHWVALADVRNVAVSSGNVQILQWRLTISLPPVYIVRREVMFSQVCVCSGGVHLHHPMGVPHHHPIILPLPLVPCPFWEVAHFHPMIVPLVPGPFPGGHPSDGSQIPSCGGTPGWTTPWPGQDRVPPQPGLDGVPPRPPHPGLVMPWVVRLLRFLTRGLSCLEIMIRTCFALVFLVSSMVTNLCIYILWD